MSCCFADHASDDSHDAAWYRRHQSPCSPSACRNSAINAAAAAGSAWISRSSRSRAQGLDFLCVLHRRPPGADNPRRAVLLTEFQQGQPNRHGSFFRPFRDGVQSELQATTGGVGIRVGHVEIRKGQPGYGSVRVTLACRLANLDRLRTFRPAIEARQLNLGPQRLLALRNRQLQFPLRLFGPIEVARRRSPAGCGYRPDPDSPGADRHSRGELLELLCPRIIRLSYRQVDRRPDTQAASGRDPSSPGTPPHRRCPSLFASRPAWHTAVPVPRPPAGPAGSAGGIGRGPARPAPPGPSDRTPPPAAATIPDWNQEASDSNPGLWRLLAEAYDRTGQAGRAVQALVQYHRLNPQDHRGNWHRQHAKLGDWQKAMDTADVGGVPGLDGSRPEAA